MVSTSGGFSSSKWKEEGKLAQSAEASLRRKLVLLDEWWLVKADPDSHGKQLGIGGFTFKGNQGIRSFSSASIVKRQDAVTLRTVDNITIMVHGFLNRSRTLENGFSQELCDHFLFGFPYYWEEFASVSVNEQDHSSTSEEFSPSSYKTPTQEFHRSDMKSVDATPPKASSAENETSLSVKEQDHSSASELSEEFSSSSYKTPTQESRRTNMESVDTTPPKASSAENETSFSVNEQDHSSASEEFSPSSCKTPTRKARRTNMKSFDATPPKASSPEKETSLSVNKQDHSSASEEFSSSSHKTPTQESRRSDTTALDATPTKASSAKKGTSVPIQSTDSAAVHKTRIAEKKRTNRMNVDGGPLTRSRARITR